MDITTAFALRSMRALKTVEASTAGAVIVLASAVIGVLVAVVALQAGTPEPVIVAPLRWY